MDVSLTQDQVDSGKYGEIIPHNAKKINQKVKIFMNLLILNII